MFGIASIWNRYSLPLRRAESPVHISLGPRMATSMPARLSSLAIAWVTLLFLSSNEPAQPTQYSYSVVSGSPGSTILTSRSLAQSPRSPWFMPHGLHWFSIAR